MKALLAPSPVSGRISLALLIARVVLGVAMIAHGAGKLDGGLTAWAGETYPAWMQAFAALGELVGGGLLVAGLATPLAALWLVGVMAGAVKHHLDAGDGFVGGYEHALAYAAFSLLFLLTGPGALSADAKLFGGKGD